MLIFLIYFGGCLALLFSAGQFIRPGVNVRRGALAGFFATIGAIQLHADLMHSQDMVFVPHLLLLNVPAIYFCGPLMAGYLEAVSQINPRFRTGYYLQLVPGIVATLAVSAIYALPADEKIVLIQEGPRKSYPVLLSVIFTIGPGLILIYAGMGLRIMIALLRSEEPVAKYRGPLTALFVLFVVVGALGYAGFVWDSLFVRRLAYVFVTLIMITLYFFSLRYPNLLLHAAEELRRQRFARDRLKGVNLAAVDQRLKVLMADERVYRDENFSVDNLAVRLRITPEQLSRFLNLQLGKNFHSFVNEYRIQEASQLLREQPKRTVLSVAYAVGFNSQSVFHDAFRRFTGTTPGRYRRDARTAQKN